MTIFIIFLATSAYEENKMTYISMVLEGELAKRLDRACEQLNLKRTAVIRIALSEYLAKVSESSS